jgi:metal-responsive CopG/Arc/MetJ family transcriptional regulator
MSMWNMMWVTIHIRRGAPLKTIQMTIDEELLARVDSVTLSLSTTRSAFIRSALELALRQHALEQMERQHAEGYSRFPTTPDEFDVWESEQTWGA